MYKLVLRFSGLNRTGCFLSPSKCPPPFIILQSQTSERLLDTKGQNLNSLFSSDLEGVKAEKRFWETDRCVGNDTGAPLFPLVSGFSRRSPFLLASLIPTRIGWCGKTRLNSTTIYVRPHQRSIVCWHLEGG